MVLICLVLVKKKRIDLFSYWTRKSPELYNNISLIKNGFKLVGNTSYNASVNELSYSI